LNRLNSTLDAADSPTPTPTVDPGPLLPVDRLRMVYQLTEAVTRARGLQEIYEAALEGLMRALSADRASILLFDADGVMRFKAWRGLSEAYRAAVEGHSPWNRDAADAEPIIVPDVLEDPGLRAFEAVFAAEGIRALGFIPLAARGRLIGKFMVYFAAPHSLDEEELGLARTIAGHVAFAVDRRQREEKLVLYREIFAHSNEAIAIIGTDGCYLEQNAAHRELLGYADAELAGKTPALHLGEARFREVAATLGQGGTYRNELTSRTRSGSSRDIELSAFTVRDDLGEPVCYVGVKRDVTDRKRTEEALTFLAAASASLDRSLDYEETLRALGALAVPFLADWALVETLDGDGRRVRATGVHADPDRGEAMARLATLRQAMPPPAGPALVTRTMERDEILGGATGEDGEALLSELGVRSVLEAPLRARGRLLGLLTLVSSRGDYGGHEMALASDLARRAATALDNARLYGEAQESDRRKEEFLAVLAHELRNPLMPLVTCLELMRSDAPDFRYDPAHREIMERQVRNLRQLVDDLLDVSRVTRGKIQLRKQPVSLAATVARAIETTSPLIQAHGHRLEVTVDPAVRLEADPLRLEQVLANLLGNASKYTPPGGRLDVGGTREGDWVVLRVRDDGAGIAPEILPHVFDLFVQGPRPSGGLGVGLTLVRALVEMHGGTVTASSPGPGQGSEFTVRLPVGALEERQLPAGEASPEVRPLRILLVDDNVDATRLLAEALRARGHDVVAAHDGRAALQHASRRAPEVVLLDLGLPDMNGYEVARMLREDAGLSRVPIIALSGYDQDRFRERSRAEGLEHVVKPVDLAQLDTILAAAARRGATERRG